MILFLFFQVWAVYFCLSGTVYSQSQDNQFRSIGPFTCSGAFNNEQVDRGFQSVFACYHELAVRFSFPKMQQETVVVIFENEEAWRNYFQQGKFQFSYRRSLFVKKDTLLKTGDLRPHIFLYLSPRFEEDLRHECIHAYMQAMLKKTVPLWLDEGLAEYYERADNRPYNEAWLEKSLMRIGQSRMKSLKQLESLTNSANLTNDEYSDSWAWINFLLNGPNEVRAIFTQYMAEISQKKIFYPSLSKMFAKQRINPERELARWYSSVTTRPETGNKQKQKNL